jgi:hypothetical protein
VDWNHWQKLYKKHQQEYLRSRLRMVKRGGNAKCAAPHPRNYRAGVRALYLQVFALKGIAPHFMYCNCKTNLFFKLNAILRHVLQIGHVKPKLAQDLLLTSKATES